MKNRRCRSDIQSGIEMESPFYFDELFFSRTDLRGKILAGNEVFQRISLYPWTELAGKPHNIIRHEAMPRAVFWLLWDRIRRGLPTGAYVRNKARDGRYYWVYAIVTPCDGGYLSVRIKPGSDLFDIVRSEYAALLKLEEDENLSPAAGAERLLARLASLGFESYDMFMAETLVAEFSGRDAELRRRPRRTLSLYRQLMPSAAKLLSAARGITEAYQTYRFVPLNLLVQAGQIGEAGAAIATISSNYNLLSDQIQQGLVDFLDAAARASHTIHQGAFLLATSYVQQEIVENFDREAPMEGIDREVERSHLTQQKSLYQQEALRSLEGIGHELKGFFDRASEMKRLALGLAAIRVMGKVESGRLSAAVLKDLIADLEAFQEILQRGLSEIFRANDGLRADASQLLDAYSTERA